MAVSKKDLRKNVLKKVGAADYDIDLLLDFNSDLFDYSSLQGEITFPLEDELFIKTWKKYESDAASLGVFPVIRKACPHLNFPINNKIADSPEYKDAVLYANFTEERLKSNDLGLKEPEKLQLAVIQTDAGSIPMLYVPDRSDFEAIIRAMNHSNTEAEIPAELTSTIIHEFRNSDRISGYRERFLKKRSLMNLNTTWRDEYNKILLKKELYLDTFIIIYGGNASAVSAKEIGLPKEEWLAKSIVIGREKEALKYYMKRIFNVEKPHPYIELIAYYSAVKIAWGSFAADILFKLMIPGFEAKSPACGFGALSQKLNRETCETIMKLLEKAAQNLEDFEKIYASELEVNDKNIMLISLTYITIEELASNIEPLEKIYFSLTG